MATEKPITLQEHAMQFGTLMGIYWIIKFTFFPLGFNIPLLHLLFILLTLFVPILGYIYTRKYREQHCSGSISFLRAFTFTSLMYMFAALLTSVAHYIYFKFIDNGFLFETYKEQLDKIKSVASENMTGSIDQFMQAFDTIASLSPLQLTLQLISQNIFYGILLALFTAPIIMKQKK